jgi:hypothetical protein
VEWLPVIFVLIVLTVIALAPLPKRTESALGRTARAVPRWAWIIIFPSIIVLTQWIRYRHSPLWVYVMGGVVGSIWGVLIALFPWSKPPSDHLA